jgi:hypothetical protein
MVRHWYAWKPDTYLYNLPAATKAQNRRALIMLRTTGKVPVDDYDAHVGAVTLVKQHLDSVAYASTTRKELADRVRSACRRPSFEVRDPCPSTRQPVTFAWIDPTTLARGRSLGKPFKPYHYSVAGVATMALDILGDRSDHECLPYLFGDPRSGAPNVVVDSLGGPFGPIRQISVNGNHRTLALEALEVPLAMAEVRTYVGPYAITLREDDDWPTVLAFLRWLEEGQVLWMSRRAIQREGPWVTLRVAKAPTPWLAASPHDALKALGAYEAFFGHRVPGFAHLDRALLLRTWRSAAGTSQRKPVEVTTVTVSGDQRKLRKDTQPRRARRSAETPPKSPH